MASTIKLKNGSGAPLASDLVAGEPALDLTNKRLYTEDSGGTVIEVGTNPTEIQIDNINIDGNTISSTDTNGNITLAPNGTGVVALSSTDLTFGDNDKATFGAGDDLQIYHDGSNSYIKDAGTGTLNLQSSDTIRLQTSDGAGGFQNVFAGVDEGAAFLYYDGSDKLQTTNTGIDVTGTVTADGLTVGSSTITESSNDLTINATDDLFLQSNSDLAIAVNANEGTGELDFVRLYKRTGEALQVACETGDISFYDSSASQAFYWDASAASLGIGTSSPRTKFDVLLSGTANTGGSLAPSLALFTGPGLEPLTDGSRAGANVNIESNTAQGANVGASLMFGGRYVDSSTVSTGFGAIYGAKENGTSNNLSGYLAFYTNRSGTTTKAMTIDSSGNLGLGVTPSAWSSNFKALQSGNGSAFVGFAGNDQTFVISNAYNDGSWKYKNSAGAGYYEIQGVGNGVHAWYNAPSGTAGAAITFTQAMTLDASGNLLVGTTSAVASERFNVTGSVATGFVTRVINSNATNPQGMLLYYSGASPNSSAAPFLYCLDTTALKAEIRSNGGLANYQSNNVDLSDERTKTDINAAPSYWDKIGALEIVTYKYKDQTHNDVNVGVIAQQVETVEPVWVDADGFGDTPEGEEPLKTVYTKDITFAAIKALQEAMTRIETLEAEVAALKGA